MVDVAPTNSPHKVTQYKKGKDSLFAQGKRRYDRKQSGYGGQTKPVFHKKVCAYLITFIYAFSWIVALSLFFLLSKCTGQDNEESRAKTGMHSLQIQDATCIKTLQAVRVLCVFFPASGKRPHLIFLWISFELGGEKKTKGAALTFVCSPVFIICVWYVCWNFTFSNLHVPYVIFVVVFFLILRIWYTFPWWLQKWRRSPPNFWGRIKTKLPLHRMQLLKSVLRSFQDGLYGLRHQDFGMHIHDDRLLGVIKYISMHISLPGWL